MKDFLQFPAKYEVSVNLNLETYLEKANLSQKGKAYLERFVLQLELIYYIRLEDRTEVPIYRVEIINGCEENEEKTQ